MAGHVVGTFVGMSKMRVVVRNKAIEIVFQVSPSGWVRVLHENQAAASVAAKNDADSIDGSRLG